MCPVGATRRVALPHVLARRLWLNVILTLNIVKGQNLVSRARRGTVHCALASYVIPAEPVPDSIREESRCLVHPPVSKLVPGLDQGGGNGDYAPNPPSPCGREAEGGYPIKPSNKALVLLTEHA